MYTLCSYTVYMNVEWAQSAHLFRELKVCLVLYVCSVFRHWIYECRVGAVRTSVQRTKGSLELF